MKNVRISCFVSWTKTFSHTHRFVPIMCIRPKRARSLCLYTFISLLRKMKYIWMNMNAIRVAGVKARRTL